MTQARDLEDRLHDVDDPRKRRLIALGLLTKTLAPQGIEPILVGGGALEFYTAGGYATSDIDLAMPSGESVDAAFAELGFRKEGRYWMRADLDLLFEAPAPAGLPGEDAPRTEIDVDGLRVVVIGIEDLLLDRLRAWVHWHSGEDERWARRLALLYADRIDWQYLRERSKGVAEEADALAQLAEEADR
ncbi:MAG: UbiD family decarboxylase [Gammaproteobacteria bacterium]|nr:UbiD family decarboxylase [Gammaproteobacteria bacterium]